MVQILIDIHVILGEGGGRRGGGGGVGGEIRGEIRIPQK